MIEGGLLAALISDDARDNVGVTGLFTSRTPPPDVTSGLSCVFFLQKDHLLPEASGAMGADSGTGASGSPSFDRVSHGDC